MSSMSMSMTVTVTVTVNVGFGSSSLSGRDSGIWLGFGSNVAIWLLLMNHASLLNHASAREKSDRCTALKQHDSGDKCISPMLSS